MSESLEVRLLALERRQRRLVRGATAAAVVLAAGILMGQVMPPPRVVPGEIRGTHLVLVDERGEPRGLLRVEDGAALVELRDDRGVVMRLGSRRGVGSVEYRDQEGLLRDLTKPLPGVQLLR